MCCDPPCHDLRVRSGVARCERPPIHLVVTLIAVTLFVATSPTLADLYVDHNATGPTHDGSTWCSALLTLQDALAAAGPGETIRVADGIYKPDQGGGQTTGDRSATFQLLMDVVIEGGYAGCGAIDPDEIDLALNETTLSGDLNGDDGPGFANNAENSLHVVTGNGTDATAVLDGFTIRGGNANGGGVGFDEDSYGGGVFAIMGSPSIVRCKLIDNAGAAAGLDSYTLSDLTLGESYVSDSTIVDSGSSVAMAMSVLAGPVCVGWSSTIEGDGSIASYLRVTTYGTIHANTANRTLEIGGWQVDDISGLLKASSDGTLLIRADIGPNADFMCGLPTCPADIEADNGTILAGANVSISAATMEIKAGGVFESDPGVAETNAAEFLANTIIVHDSPPGGVPGRVTIGGSMSGSTSGHVDLDGNVAAGDSSSTPPILNVTGNASLQIGGDLIIQGAAIIDYDSTEPLQLEGNFDNMSVRPAGFDWREGKIILVAPGSPPPTQIIEAAGRDNGVSALIAAEYEFGSLELPTAADILVTDSFDNDQAGQSSCSEALYVDELILRNGATLTLNDTVLYYKTLVDEGATINLVGCGALALNPYCSTASQCDDEDVCTIDVCDAGGACANNPGGMQLRFEQTVLGRGYCSNDPALACMADGDCTPGVCGKSAYGWTDTLAIRVAFGSFTNSSQLSTYPTIGVVPMVTHYFYHTSDPGPDTSFWYLVRLDCPPGTSWQTSPGAEPGRDNWLP